MFNLSVTQPVLHSVAVRAVERICATACFLFWLVGQLCRMGLGFKVHSHQMDQPFFETTLARLELHLGGACMQVNLFEVHVLLTAPEQLYRARQLRPSECVRSVAIGD